MKDGYRKVQRTIYYNPNGTRCTEECDGRFVPGVSYSMVMLPEVVVNMLHLVIKKVKYAIERVHCFQRKMPRPDMILNQV